MIDNFALLWHKTALCRFEDSRRSLCFIPYRHGVPYQRNRSITCRNNFDLRSRPLVEPTGSLHLLYSRLEVVQSRSIASTQLCRRRSKKASQNCLSQNGYGLNTFRFIDEISYACVCCKNSILTRAHTVGC